MSFRLLLSGALAAATLVSGCASYMGAAGTYAARGKHELAALYMAHHLRREPDDADARAELVRTIEAALKALDADADRLGKAGDWQAVLGIGERREAVVDLARGMRLNELDAVDAGAIVRTTRPKAARAAVEAVDRVEAEGADPRKQAALLRRALALDPNNSELAGRYKRLTSGLQLMVAPRIACDPRYAEACRLFLGRLLTRISAERREFTQLVPEGSEIRNAELVATVTVAPSSSPWRRIKGGTAKGKVPVKDRFQETKKDRKGRPITQPVQARYEIFEAESRAEVRIRLTVRDLGPKNAVLFDASPSANERDKRAYISFSGDERALGGLASVGTDQTPPTAPDALARKAILKIADQLAKATLTQLEKAPK